MLRCVCLINNDAEVSSMVIYSEFVIYDATVYARTQERDIIYCGNNNILRVIYDNEESIYDLDSIYDEYKISRVCLKSFYSNSIVLV